MNIRFLTLAQKEVDESVRWYDEQASLGRDFLDELDRAVRLIKRDPGVACYEHPSGDAPPGTPVRTYPRLLSLTPTA